MGKMTNYQRAFLSKMLDGPRTIDQCRGARANIMPVLVRKNWVRSLDFTERSKLMLDGMEVYFVLTPDGLSALEEHNGK